MGKAAPGIVFTWFLVKALEREHNYRKTSRLRTLFQRFLTNNHDHLKPSMSSSHHHGGLRGILGNLRMVIQSKGKRYSFVKPLHVKASGMEQRMFRSRGHESGIYAAWTPDAKLALCISYGAATPLQDWRKCTFWGEDMVDGPTRAILPQAIDQSIIKDNPSHQYFLTTPTWT